MAYWRGVRLLEHFGGQCGGSSGLPAATHACASNTRQSLQKSISGLISSYVSARFIPGLYNTPYRLKIGRERVPDQYELKNITALDSMTSVYRIYGCHWAQFLFFVGALASVGGPAGTHLSSLINGAYSRLSCDRGGYISSPCRASASSGALRTAERTGAEERALSVAPTPCYRGRLRGIESGGMTGPCHDEGRAREAR